MIVYAIKNKDNEYLYIDERRDIDFYDEVYLATFLETSQTQKPF